jgi:hypothetical protein
VFPETWLPAYGLLGSPERGAEGRGCYAPTPCGPSLLLSGVSQPTKNMRFTMPPSCILASPGMVADDESECIHDFTCKVVILVFPFGSIECHHPKVGFQHQYSHPPDAT